MKFTKQVLWLILLAIILGGFIVRLYRLDNPIADWHSWRQSDTSAVSWNFVHKSFDPLHPIYFDISNVQSGKDNPQGLRYVEFPLYNIAQAGLFEIFGGLTLEEWGRIVSILSSSLASLFLFLIVSRHSNKIIGLLAAFFYTFIPYDIYYGRTILPDTSMVMATLGGIYFFDKWLEYIEKYSSSERSESRSIMSKSSRLHHVKHDSSRTITTWLFFCVALVFTTAAFLLKPYALFFVLPMVVLAYHAFGIGLVKKWQLYIFAIIAVLPLVFWREWIGQHPEGVPANTWLLNGNGIRFRPAFFKWIFYERLTKLISGYLGIVIVLFGLFNITKIKEWLFFLSFLLSSLLYVCVFATGNVQHDYYQILVMPSVAIIYAIGSNYLYLWKPKKLPIGQVMLVISVIGLFWFGWAQVKDYFNINNRSIVAAGEAVDRLTPKNAKIIAPYDGDTSFLYQTKRQGWPSFEHDLPTLIQMGASYLVLVNPKPQDLALGKTYKIIASTPQYVIFDLKQKM